MVIRYILEMGSRGADKDATMDDLIKQLPMENPQMISFAQALREEGWDEGMAKGRAEGAYEIAKRLLKVSMDRVLISETTGVSMKELDRLAKTAEEEVV